MRLGTRRHIDGRELFLVGKSANQHGTRFTWFCPVTRKRIRTNQKGDRRSQPVEANDEQRRLAEQVGLDIREVIKLTGGVR